MSTRKFWATLRTCKGKFKVNYDGEIRSKDGNNCPVSFAANTILGKIVYYSITADDAGRKEFNMTTEEVNKIMDAADDTLNFLNDKVDRRTRRKLFKVLGLK